MIETTCSYDENSPLPVADLKEPMSYRLNRIYDEMSKLLPKGFRAIIEIDDESIKSRNNNTDFPDSHHPLKNPNIFRMYAEVGDSGSFAEAKMRMLNFWTSDAATGQLSKKQVIGLLQYDPSYHEHLHDPLMQEILQLEDLSQLLRRHHEYLRDTFNFTTFAGGIRVPFMVATSKFRGEIRISFSALTQEQDICMCLMIFRNLQIALRDLLKVQSRHDWAEYDLSGLAKIPQVNFYLDAYNISSLVG